MAAAVGGRKVPGRRREDSTSESGIMNNSERGIRLATAARTSTIQKPNSRLVPRESSKGDPLVLRRSRDFPFRSTRKIYISIRKIERERERKKVVYTKNNRSYE